MRKFCIVFDFFEFLTLILKYGQYDGRDRSYVGIESYKNIYGSLMK
jgi:hypothetical protein